MHLEKYSSKFFDGFACLLKYSWNGGFVILMSDFSTEIDEQYTFVVMEMMENKGKTVILGKLKP